MRSKAILLAALALGCALVPARVGGAARVPKFMPTKERGDVVLFDAATSDFALIRNYTASWVKGSDLTPVVTRVTKDGRTFAAYAFRGRRGTACSTYWYEFVPPADDGTRYGGIRFTIDYDEADSAKVSAMAKFTDGTGLTALLTLERGCREYVFCKGFRRSKAPVKWELLSYMWLSTGAHGDGNPLAFRLQRAVMYQQPAGGSGPSTPAVRRQRPPRRGESTYYLRPGDVVLVLGDATAADGRYYERMVHADLAERYPALAGGDDGRSVQFVNAGVASETASAGARRLGGLLARHKPTVVVIAYGLSDLLDGDASFVSAVRGMIAELKRRSIAITVLSPPGVCVLAYPWLEPHAMELGKMADALRTVASQTGATYVDCQIPVTASDRDVSWGDGIHPNDEGHRLIADALQEAWGVGKPLYDGGGASPR